MPEPAAIATVPRKALYLTLGGLFVTLGAVGVLLPVLPTTPFLLLASYFLIRSSPRLNAMLYRSHVLGPLLQDWKEWVGIKRDTKIAAILLVLVTVGLTLYWSPESMPIRIGIIVLTSVGIGVILRLPVINR